MSMDAQGKGAGIPKLKKKKSTAQHMIVLRWKTTTHSPNLSDSPRKFSNKQFEFDHGPNSRTFWLASSNETASCVSIQDERPYFQ
jgi:hypothetical protein